MVEHNTEKKENTSEKKGKNFKKIKNNPWMISSVVLAVLLLSFFIFGSSCLTGNVVSGKIAGENWKTYLENYGYDVEINSVEKVTEGYNVSFEYDEGEDYVLITSDGENYIYGLVPIISQENEEEETSQDGKDWSVFENSLPESVETKISNFPTGNIEEINQDLGLVEFTNFEEIPNTLIVLYSESCGYCSLEYDVLLDLQDEYPTLQIYALDYTQNREIAQKYSASGTPANIINGKYFVSGYKPLDTFEEVLTEIGY